MDPNGASPPPQNPTPGQPPAAGSSSGSDWQRQAMDAVRASTQPAPVVTPAGRPPVDPRVAPRVPDWQRGFQHHSAAPQSEVPDMLAPADTAPPAAPPSPPAPLPQLPSAPEVNPMPGAMFGQPIVPGAFGNEMPAGPGMGQGRPKSAVKLLIIVGAIAATVALSAVAYFVIFAGNGSDSVKKANEQSSNSAASTAIDLSTLSNVTFSPSDLSGYTKDAASSSDTYTTYITSDKTCAVGFGTVPASSFPGSTVEEMVDAQVQSLRKLGATADGPHAADALVLKSASDPGTTYKMPTLSFTFSKDGASGKVLYSIVVLKNKRLAIVNRQCGNPNGPVLDANLDAQDKKARELLVVASQAP